MKLRPTHIQTIRVPPDPTSWKGVGFRQLLASNLMDMGKGFSLSSKSPLHKPGQLTKTQQIPPLFPFQVRHNPIPEVGR